MSKLVKNKEIPCCTSMWGLEMLLRVFIRVCIYVYTYMQHTLEWVCLVVQRTSLWSLYTSAQSDICPQSFPDVK